MEASSPIKGLAYGAIASMAAEVATMPIDVVKVRLQYAGADGQKMYSGVMDAAKKTVKAEGPGALFKGIQPALVRQCFYGGLRYGLYAPFRNALGVDPDMSVKSLVHCSCMVHLILPFRRVSTALL